MWQEYAVFIVLGVALLVLLPPLLTPYMGIFGVYASYAVTGVTLALLLWLFKKTKKAAL